MTAQPAPLITYSIRNRFGEYQIWEKTANYEIQLATCESEVAAGMIVAALEAFARR